MDATYYTMSFSTPQKNLLVIFWLSVWETFLQDTLQRISCSFLHGPQCGFQDKLSAVYFWGFLVSVPYKSWYLLSSQKRGTEMTWTSFWRPKFIAVWGKQTWKADWRGFLEKNFVSTLFLLCICACQAYVTWSLLGENQPREQDFFFFFWSWFLTCDCEEAEAEPDTSQKFFHPLQLIQWKLNWAGKCR